MDAIGHSDESMGPIMHHLGKMRAYLAPAAPSGPLTDPSRGIMKQLISKYLIRRGFDRLQRKIAKLGGQGMDAEETVRFLFSPDAELIQPWQFKEELLGLALEIEALRPKTVVEIGTANGGTLFMSSRLATDEATIISIDLPGGRFGGGFPEWKVPYYMAFARKEQRMELLRGNSQDPAIFAQVKKALNGQAIDHLFIDGDHIYEGVKADYERYGPLVRPGGKIVFHDVVPHRGACQVDVFWRELREKVAYCEYINDLGQGKFGIGIVQV